MDTMKTVICPNCSTTNRIKSNADSSFRLICGRCKNPLLGTASNGSKRLSKKMAVIALGAVTLVVFLLVFQFGSSSAEKSLSEKRVAENQPTAPPENVEKRNIEVLKKKKLATVEPPPFDFRRLGSYNSIEADVKALDQNIDSWKENKTSRSYAKAVITSLDKIAGQLERLKGKSVPESDMPGFLQMETHLKAIAESISKGWNGQISSEIFKEKAVEVFREGIKNKTPVSGTLGAIGIGVLDKIAQDHLEEELTNARDSFIQCLNDFGILSVYTSSDEAKRTIPDGSAADRM